MKAAPSLIISCSDGISSNTTITLPDGTPLKNVVGVDIIMRAGQPVRAVVAFDHVQVNTQVLEARGVPAARPTGVSAAKAPLWFRVMRRLTGYGAP